METTSHLRSSPTLTALDTMASSSEPAHFLKLEDLHASSASSPAPSTFDGSSALSQASPPPVIIQSKPAKKRKSWGQELPEPKTTLPPRKRAKTDDEKEQRRIERIKRNRAAAHNSRERKRQETETLAVALAKANAELAAYKKLHGPLPSNIVLPEVTVCTEDCDTPAPSLSDSRDTMDESAPSPATPVDATSPDFSHIKQEPLDMASDDDTYLHPAFLDNLDLKSSGASSTAFSLLDLTQHSAAMLCDLPCRSSSAKRSSSSNSHNPLLPTSSTPAITTWWSTLLLCLMAHNLRTCYKTLTLALWTISPSRMARMMLASAIRSSRSTSSSTTRRSSRSTPRRLALPSAATGWGAPRPERRRLLGAAVAAVGERDGVRLASAEGEDRHHRIRKAFGEHPVGGRRTTSDAGDEKDGVGRG